MSSDSGSFVKIAYLALKLIFAQLSLAEKLPNPPYHLSLLQEKTKI